jgi:hypothetical protein
VKLRWPSIMEVRAGAGGLALFSAGALLVLLTTTPPAGRYYPRWGFWLAWLGIVAGLGTIMLTFIFPRPTPTIEGLDRPLRPSPRPTEAEVMARRAARQKADRGERLTRTERKLLQRADLGVTRRGFLEHLGRNLQLGEHYLDPIRWAGEAFQQEWQSLGASGLDEAALMKRLDELWDDDASKDAGKWEQTVKKSLGEYLDDSYVARFGNDAGLTPAAPPPSLTDSHYVRIWQHHQMRLQRLHEIIMELSAKWSLP